MNYATITITILAFVIIAQRLHIWLQDDALKHMEHHCRELERIGHDACDQRDTALQAHAHLNERVGAYLREATLLVAENERLKRGEGWIDADDVIAHVEAWLAQEGIS